LFLRSLVSSGVRKWWTCDVPCSPDPGPCSPDPGLCVSVG
jgi:hypothetical protein